MKYKAKNAAVDNCKLSGVPGNQNRPRFANASKQGVLQSLKHGTSFLILVSIILFSCRTTDSLIGKSYVYKSKKRTLELQIDNDSLCRLINTFYCNDLNLEVKTIKIELNYKRIGNKLIVKNIDPNKHFEGDELFLNIPVQNSIECDFLNLDQRKKYKTIGPSVTTGYEKYGLVPRIDIDTFYIHKSKLILYKQNEYRSIGFVFR
jgi:hypothetical protein